MDPILNGSSARARLLNTEIEKRMAKVHTLTLQKAEIAAFRTDVGACIEQVRCLSRLTLEQFAGALDRDASQVSKWIRNEEPPQLETMLMSPFRGLMLEALTERTPGYQVRTTIERIA